MDPEFGQWYRAELEPSAEMLAFRWNGIESFATDISVSDILDLARLFYKAKPRSEDAVPRFRHAFSAEDSTFRTQGNDFEIAILAGATICHILSKENTLSDVAAYSMICPQLAGKRTTFAVLDILNRSFAYIHSAAVSCRQTQIAPYEFVATSSLRDTLKSLGEEWTTETLANKGAQVQKCLQTLVKENGQLAERLSGMAQDVVRFREDSNILWWVTGGHSRDLRKPFAGMDAGQVCIIAGKELADLTELMPEPFSAKAVLYTLLEKVGVDLTKQIVISTSVGCLDDEWRELWVSSIHNSIALDLCPIMFASLRASESDGSDWHSAFKTVTTVGAKSRIDPLDLAEQVYHECLLLKAIHFEGS